MACQFFERCCFERPVELPRGIGRWMGTSSAWRATANQPGRPPFFSFCTLHQGSRNHGRIVPFLLSPSPRIPGGGRGLSWTSPPPLFVQSIFQGGLIDKQDGEIRGVQISFGTFF